MTTTKDWEAEFDTNIPCIQSGCDQNGTIAERGSDGEWEPAQCQFCCEVRFPAKEWIRNLLLAQKNDLKGVMEGMKYGGVMGQPYSDGYNQALTDILDALDV